MRVIESKSLALLVARRHLAVHRSFDHYTGIVTLHGMARLANLADESPLLDEARQMLMPYVKGERSFHANFPNYYCGGNASAYLLWAGHLPEAREPVRRYAEQILREAPRDNVGILCHPAFPGEQRIWIDVAFAVTPFLLFAGLALDERRYVDEAVFQTVSMVRELRNPENGLVHQSKNFTDALPGRISADHWSRGNGWGAYGLVELACHLPADHPQRDDVVALYRDHVLACQKFQDAQGLWHQEMTEPQSYTETSGSALMLYALGAGIDAKLLDDSHRPRFEQGIRGLLHYITPDLDIFHTCRGCLCPGDGTQLEYMAVAPQRNDVHAFGPVVLAMGQAHQLGISTITRD